MTRSLWGWVNTVSRYVAVQVRRDQISVGLCQYSSKVAVAVVE